MEKRFLFSVLLVVGLDARDPQFYTVFKPNDGKYPCYRQVSISFGLDWERKNDLV